mgnify:CR=1 FL=1
MKQLIVLVATIILGLAIGGIITGFASDAESIADTASKSMGKIAESAVDLQYSEGVMK